MYTKDPVTPPPDVSLSLYDYLNIVYSEKKTVHGANLRLRLE